MFGLIADLGDAGIIPLHSIEVIIKNGLVEFVKTGSESLLYLGGKAKDVGEMVIGKMPMEEFQQKYNTLGENEKAMLQKQLNITTELGLLLSGRIAGEMLDMALLYPTWHERTGLSATKASWQMLW